MGNIIHLAVPLPCDVQTAFNMFTVNKLLESWLAIKANVEPVKDGRYELFWDPSDPNHNSTLGCRITSIEQGHFLSFEWKGPKQFEHFMNTFDPLTHVIIFFLPCPEAPDHCTEVHLIHTGWRNSSEWEEARKWVEKSWREAFTRLSEIVSLAR
ncbi:MAG: SRPBCC family protein [Candidatus Ranarchaeia archaeon]